MNLVAICCFIPMRGLRKKFTEPSVGSRRFDTFILLVCLLVEMTQPAKGGEGERTFHLQSSRECNAGLIRKESKGLFDGGDELELFAKNVLTDRCAQSRPHR